MDIHKHNVEVLGQQLEQALQKQVIAVPTYRTVEPKLRPATRHVGTLDGSDQQLFAFFANPDLGVGIWATEYVEVDVQGEGDETYRDGPISAGAWSEDELLMYHLTVSLPDVNTTRGWQNDLYTVRQFLSHIRVADPPLFADDKRIPVRAQAAQERATGEWLALHAAVVHQLAPGDLILKDGRLNCQIEMPAHWVDNLGRTAARNEVRVVSVIKSGTLYQELYPIVQEIAAKNKRAFWFPVPSETIERAYANEKYPLRKTLMLGGRDNLDLAGIGALWTAFCPDPGNYRTFVILEFNLYDLTYYRKLARTPQNLRQWQSELINPRRPKGSYGNVKVTDLLIEPDYDIGQLLEPTLAEILWLCEREVGHFGYPNLLGTAHRDVVLTKRKVDQLRRRYKDILSFSDRILSELVEQDVVENPHKLHNIP